MAKDKNKMQLVPDARLLLTSLRSVGYTPKTAIADIIDNSVSSRASEIQIHFQWDDENSYITIKDNGRGMDQSALFLSMRIGSNDPSVDREEEDLGRFGMGMKTAAFSLGKKLTVVTKANRKYSDACWDLEYEEKKATYIRSQVRATSQGLLLLYRSVCWCRRFELGLYANRKI